ncbi:hypothetical protein QFC19_006441 [Naganishia cerealis]|uniref:Uncharacterized protein n=1 Tax=Naganishia cerealis TaxID=610337 RepID=A0ACC2VG87_9TREE|nr:hypothetical protein QFC19_006441 [Naganishia cerealis]
MHDSLPAAAADLARSLAFAVAESALDDPPSSAVTEDLEGHMYPSHTSTHTYGSTNIGTVQRVPRRDSCRDLPKPSKGPSSPWFNSPFSMMPTPSPPAYSQDTTMTAAAAAPAAAKATEISFNAPTLPPGFFDTPATNEPHTMRANAPVFSYRPNAAGRLHTRSQSELLPPAAISSPPRTAASQQLFSPDHSQHGQQQRPSRPAHHRATCSVVGVPREKEEGMLPFPRGSQPMTSRTFNGHFSAHTRSSSAKFATTSPSAGENVAFETPRNPFPVRGRAGLPTLAEITAHYRSQGRTHEVTVSEIQDIASPPHSPSPLAETCTSAPAFSSATGAGKTSSQAMAKRYSLESNESYGSSQSNGSTSDDTDSGLPTTPPSCDTVSFGAHPRVMSGKDNGESRLPSFLRNRVFPQGRKSPSPSPASSTPGTSTLAHALAKHRRRAVSHHAGPIPLPASMRALSGHVRRTGSIDSYGSPPSMTTTPFAANRGGVLGMGHISSPPPMLQVTPPSTKLSCSATFTATSRGESGHGNGNGDETDYFSSRQQRPARPSPVPESQTRASTRSSFLQASQSLSSNSVAVATRPCLTTAGLPGAPLISFTPPTAPPGKADTSPCAELQALAVNARIRRDASQAQKPRQQRSTSVTVVVHGRNVNRKGNAGAFPLEEGDKEREDCVRRQRAEHMLSALGKRRAEARATSASEMVMGV